MMSSSKSSPESTATVTLSPPSSTPLPPLDLSVPPPLPFRSRGHSLSTARDPSASTLGTSLTRFTSAPNVPNTSSLSISAAANNLDDRPVSSFRSRSRSPRKIDDSLWGKATEVPTPPEDSPSTWWNGSDLIRRPWRDPPRKKKTVPAEQTEGWINTRQRVAQAAASVLGTAGDIAHEALFLTVDLLDFAPIPGLRSAGRTLLSIWDTLQLVDMNRLACLRLTERCADILLSVRQEVKDAGDSVGEELDAPILKLIESFTQVHNFLQKQTHRPFLKRYLRRDEILRQIAECDAGLGEALGMFSLSIQIRILKQVQAAEARRKSDTQELLNTIINSRSPSNALQLTGVESDAITITGLPPSSSHKSLEGPDSITVTDHTPPSAPLAIQASPRTMSPSQILSALRTLHSRQNYLDAAADVADLRQLMRLALQTTSDVEMLEVLQIGKEEMPEAIKTLQRALERVVEKDGSLFNDDDAVARAEEAAKAKVGRRVSVKGILRGKAIQPPNLKRTKTLLSVQGSGSSGSGGDVKVRDTLDQEFIESGIDCLRRMSMGVETNLPSWTITRYEVDREQKIGIGFFSDVYKGTWRGRTVAIKVLAEITPRELFLREVRIWKKLRHPNVLELYGASSTCGDPPWFFVSPYEKNGSLVEFLKRVAIENPGAAGIGLGIGIGGTGSVGTNHGRLATFPVLRGRSPGSVSPGRESPLGGRGRPLSGSGAGTWSPSEVPREADLYRFMHEIAKGMEYLHQNEVLHGDLKAANVLVNDKLRCVISDFGQSEMKSEAYRISGTPPPHGTLRWQAPELMTGQSQSTPEMDVYAYAISCIEILTMGRMPWSLMDDDAVRHFVLKDNSRPPIPNSRWNTPALQELLRVCWHRDPSVRPSFSKIVRDVKQMRKNVGQPEEAYSPAISELLDLEEHISHSSPDMRPIPLPGSPPRDVAAGPLSGTSPGSMDNAENRTARDASHSPQTGTHKSYREDTVSTSHIKVRQPVVFTPSVRSSRASSIFINTPSTLSEENLTPLEYDGYDSPPPADERIVEMKNERRYRLLLSHPYHPSLTLPLWDPVPVFLGDVGYLDRPQGTFVTLFNSLNPETSSNASVRAMPSLYGYGGVQTGSQRQDKRNAAQRGLDAVVGLLTWRSNVARNISRRYSIPLRAGHKTAHLCTESTIYRYVESLETPKKWFKAHVDSIMRIYGDEHHIQKEDLYLVIGTLDAPDYALFVSHNHPDGQAHFNVYSSPRNGQPWGTFTIDNHLSPELGGPSYDEPVPESQPSSSKVSCAGDPWNTLLIAKLRFKPDAVEPTSL